MKNLAAVGVILVSVAISMYGCDSSKQGLKGGGSDGGPALGGVGSGGSATGGSDAAGGATGVGGATSQRGSSATGGTGAGGAPGVDGAIASGGATNHGSGGGPGGTMLTGGAAGNGGITGNGGAATTGGAKGGGGRTGTGGSGAGGSGTGGTGRGGTGGIGTGGAGGAGTGGTGTAPTNPCLVIPTLDRTCTTAEDCFAASTIGDCCGSGRSVGLRKSEQAQYAELLTECQKVWPACACPTGPTILDDGSVIISNTSVGVTCREGGCTTFVPACEGPCGSGTTCFSCQVPGGQFSACTTPCKDVDGGTDCPNPDLPRCQQGTSGNTYGTFCTGATAACDSK